MYEFPVLVANIHVKSTFSKINGVFIIIEWCTELFPCVRPPLYVFEMTILAKQFCTQERHRNLVLRILELPH